MMNKQKVVELTVTKDPMCFRCGETRPKANQEGVPSLCADCNKLAHFSKMETTKVIVDSKENKEATKIFDAHQEKMKMKANTTQMPIIHTLLRLEKAEFELYLIRASLRAMLTPEQKMELSDAYEKQSAARYTPEGHFKEGI